MEEETDISRSASDTLSLAEMQQKPIYVRRDIKTTNPRRLFRNLRNAVEELGYAVTYNPINIQKDAVGDTGFVDANITSKKTVVGETKTGGGYTLDFSSAPDIAKYSLIGGALLFLIGLAVSGWICLIGFIAILFGILPMLKERPKEIQGINQIWIKGEGEVYRGQLSESRSERGMQQDQIISELSVSIAGESSIDLEELGKDVNQLTKRLEALSE